MTRALTHGLYARSPSALEIRGRKVARLMRKLRVVAPWLEPLDESTARAYCELEILSAAIFARLTQMGVTRSTKDGKDLNVRPLVDAHRQMKQAQLAYARELGLTPVARQALKASGASAALDLAEIAAPVTERVIEVGEARGKTVEVDEDGSNPADRPSDKPAGV